jgi:hypothetical protein
MDDHEEARLDAICAHIEEHGIGEVLSFLSFDEAERIEARGSLKKYLQRKRADFKDSRGDPREIIPTPAWVRGSDRESQRYVNHVRNGYIRQLKGLPKRGKARLDRINDIKQRYLKEMRTIRKNLDRQAAGGYRNAAAAPAASAIGSKAFCDMDEETWLAHLGADFDYWVACL